MVHGVTLASLRAVATFTFTAILIVWLTHLAISRASLGDLTLGLLLRGTDPFRGSTVGEALAGALGRSAGLLLAAIGLAAVIGFTSGVAYTLSSWRIARAAAWAIGTAGVALPSFFWAMLLQLFVVIVFLQTQTRILPTAGFGLDEHLVLPALALAARPAAYVFRTTATAFDEARRGDYVRTAYAKGLTGMLIARRHVLPNAAPAILAGIGLGARTALSSLAIVEYVFSWNGAGYAFIHSLANGRIALATLIGLSFAAAFAALAVGLEVWRPGKRAGQA